MVEPAVSPAPSSPPPAERDPASFAAWTLIRQAELLEKAIRAAREALPEEQGRKGQRAELAQAARACRRAICALARVVPARALKRAG